MNMKSSVQELTFGPVTFILGKNKGRYPFCNSLYLKESGVLIDPACGRGTLKRLEKSAWVSNVWLSHCHWDHFTDIDLFYDIPLWMSELDAGGMQDSELYLDSRGIPDVFRDIWRNQLFNQFHYKPRDVQRLLKDGDVLSLGDVTVEVIHTPGHTLGHLAFYFQEPEVLFLGDYDLTSTGPWYCDRDSDIEDTIHSIQRLRDLPAKIWLTSHASGVFKKNPGGLWDIYLNTIRDRENKLLSFLGEAKTMQEIVAAGMVYNRPDTKTPFFIYGEMAFMAKHLEWGLKKSIIKTQGDTFIRSDA